ncbi:hypothetical protein F4678DRAFT_461223 [Xylaria arbuscula]|nr:hypothetical protein F4678DRAFT_461223 [Xylaria arbuscula]
MSQEIDLGIRLQALTLHSEGFSRAKIIEKTGYSAGGFSALLAKAKKRGYQPGKPILSEYVDSGPRSGRPTKLTQAQRNKIVATLTSDKACRKLNTQKLADKINAENPNDVPVSRRTVLRCLTAEGFKNVKYITQPNTAWRDRT